MKNITLILSTTSFLFLASCASKFSSEQQAALTSLDVKKPTVAADAYKEPIGNSEIDSSAAIIGLGGGVLGALIGEAVTSGIEAGQRAGFSKTYGEAAAQAKGSVPSTLTSTVEEKTEWALNNVSEQLKGKITSSGSNTLNTEINAYGYKRTGKTDSKILMTPYISGTTTILINGEPAGKPIYITGQAYEANGGGREITEYVGSKSLSSADFTKAAEKYGENVSSAIDSRF